MSGMEFTWRMVATLVWPAVVIGVVVAFPWITKNLDSIGVTWGSLGLQLKTLNKKVDTVGENISITLSDNMPLPVAPDKVPESLVDLMATVNRNRMEGIRAAFELVHRALKENYPQLRRVLPAQLPEAMQRLVDNGEMEPDVALSVKQLYELLTMPQWSKAQPGDTLGYAFLMLAEGAIHGILRSARFRSAEPGTVEPGITEPGITEPGKVEPASARPEISGPSPATYDRWRGTYDNRFPIELQIDSWSGPSFHGTMTYPEEGPEGNTVTAVDGTAEDNASGNGVRLEWRELSYVRRGRRDVDLKGEYKATIRDDTMDGAWYQGNRLVAQFTMAASGDGTV